MGVALSFLRNFGVLKGASGALGALSAGVGSLTGDELGQRERQEARSERDISGVGQGLVEGGTALGQGFLRGVTGLVSKPLQGAQAGGASGARSLYRPVPKMFVWACICTEMRR